MEKSGVIILLIIHFLILIYNMAKEYNPILSKKIYNSKQRIIKRLKININVENKRFTFRQLLFIFISAGISLLLTNEMIIILLIFGIAIIIPRFRMNFETFKKVFEEHNPTLKKYNSYLLFLLVSEVLILAFSLLAFK